MRKEDLLLLHIKRLEEQENEDLLGYLQDKFGDRLEICPRDQLAPVDIEEEDDDTDDDE